MRKTVEEELGRVWWGRERVEGGEEPTQLRAMTEVMEWQGKHEAHEVPMRDVERVGEAFWLGTT